MIEKTILIFTEKEEEFIGLLTDIGLNKNIAQLLVYLSELKRASSHDIEHGTGLRQPDVSNALKYLVERGWIERRKSLVKSKGRPVSIWNLVLPFDQILDIIIYEKQQELQTHMEMVQRVWNYL